MPTIRGIGRNVLLQSPKKRLHNAHSGSADFAPGNVCSDRFLSVNTLVGVIVQLDNSSVESNSGE